MTLQEVAEYLQLSKDLIYRLAQSGRIPASKVGSRWRFRRERVDRWMEGMAVDTNASDSTKMVKSRGSDSMKNRTDQRRVCSSRVGLADGDVPGRLNPELQQ